MHCDLTYFSLSKKNYFPLWELAVESSDCCIPVSRHLCPGIVCYSSVLLGPTPKPRVRLRIRKNRPKGAGGSFEQQNWSFSIARNIFQSIQT